MKTGWTVGKKLTASFMAVAVITLLLGVVGYYGVNKGGEAVTEIGIVRLPSVDSLLVMSEAQMTVDGAEDALLSRDIDLKTRQEKYAALDAAWKHAEDAWKVYEPLPQTSEEAQVWKKFVPAWDAWKKDHQAYVASSKEYDKTIESRNTSDALYKKMNTQALVTNGITFNKAAELLNKIVAIYSEKAKADTTGKAYDSTAFWTIQSLLTMSQAQTEIDSAENALLSREIEMKARQEQYDRIAACWKRAEDAWKVYEPLDQFPEEKILWAQFVPAWNAWKADDETYLKLSKDYDQTIPAQRQSDELYAKMTTQATTANAITFVPADQLLGKLVEINTTVADETVKASMAQAAFLKVLSLIAMIIGVVAAMGLGLLISRSINIALRRIAANLGSGADQTASAAGQVAQSSQSMAEGASEQASSLEETSASLEQMTSMTKQNAENATQAKNLAATANASADKGIEAMTKMSTAIDDIKKSADATAKIIKTIDEIAFQTNLLALNAAVEAARAGDAGKGFAVVAEEVRNLAQRSAEAAKNTAAMIEESVTNAENGVQISREVGDSLKDIAEAARKVNSLVAEIASASNEQAQGIEQVTTAVAQMDQVTQSNAASSEESASASEELSGQAEEMNRMVQELVAMVGAAGSKERSLKRRANGEGRPARKPLAPVKPGHSGALVASAAGKHTVVNPHDVIPLDDEDMKDF